MKKLALLACFYLAGLNLFAQAPTEVGWWKLSEGTGSTALDLSSNGNNGTWNGTPTGTSGYYSAGYNHPWAGQFDGSTDYIDLGNPAILTTNYITVACWVKLSSLPSSTFPVNKNAGNGAPSWEIYTTNNEVGALVNNGSTYGIAQTGPLLSAGTWTHLAFTYDGSKLATYVNGVLEASASLTGTIATSPTFAVANYFE
jgi:hypothetical protein